MVSKAPRVANVDMAQIWDGDEGEDWARNDDRYNAAVARFDAALFDAAAVAPGDAILDVGCGCGSTTLEAARRAHAGHALGVDLSARMLETARARARRDGVTNVQFVQADAQVHQFGAQSFDVAISRFGAMFFADPVAAFTNIATALRSGARLVLLGWQEAGRNEWMMAIRTALAVGRTLPEPAPGQPGPFGLADAGGVRRVLEAAGFRRPEVAACSAPVWLGADSDDAAAFVGGMGMARGLLADLDEESTADAVRALRSTFAACTTPDGVLLGGAAWVITTSRS